MSVESSAVAEWIYSNLAADNSITGIVDSRIYEGPAPQGSTYPIVRFEQQSTLDVMGATEATRIMVNELWLIRAIGMTQSYRGDLQTLANRIDALFHNTDGSVADALVFSSAREYAMRLPEEDQGISYRHLGGIYRIYAQAR